MDNLTSLNIEQTSNNYFKLKNKNKNIKLKIDNILCPFSSDNQYGNMVIKLEMIKIIKNI